MAVYPPPKRMNEVFNIADFVDNDETAMTEGEARDLFISKEGFDSVDANLLFNNEITLTSAICHGDFQFSDTARLIFVNANQNTTTMIDLAGIVTNSINGITNTVLGYISTLTSNAQTQLANLQSQITSNGASITTLQNELNSQKGSGVTVYLSTNTQPFAVFTSSPDTNNLYGQAFQSGTTNFTQQMSGTGSDASWSFVPVPQINCQLLVMPNYGVVGFEYMNYDAYHNGDLVAPAGYLQPYYSINFKNTTNKPVIVKTKNRTSFNGHAPTVNKTLSMRIYYNDVVI